MIHAGTARADDEPKSDESHPTSYWHVSFLGGVVKPLGDNADNHDLGLLAGGRIGWSHRVGLGLAISGFYSPLPRKTDPLLPLVTYENHFAVLVGGPQLSLVWKRLRVWMAAGAGMAMERARRFDRNLLVEKKTEEGMAAGASAGVELHFIASGGLVIAGDYTRTFKDLGFSTAPYQLADLSAGIVFLFR
ncbi:MAG TPA: hypothetical protein VL172_18520 [Kofleriaceae bacterium]|nr:hypothetical protein [Kofleriaceae bacterium]